MPPKASTQPPPPDFINKEEEYDSSSSSSDEEQEQQVQPLKQKAAEPSTKPDKHPVEEEEEEQSEGDSEEYKTPAKPNSVFSKPSAQKPIQTPNPHPDSSSESESEEGSEEATADDFIVKANVSKSMEEVSSKSKKPALKRPPSSVTPSKPSSGAKRPVESEQQNEKDSKRNKISKVVEEVGQKKSSSGSHRLWSLDDEVAILKGMIECRKEKGAAPYTDMSAFHEFIKKRVHNDVSKNQLTDKIRRLKKKYQNNAPKVQAGMAPDFFVPHDNVMFELSRKIWGVNGSRSSKAAAAAADNGVVNNNKSNPRKATKGEKVDNFVDSEKKGGEDIVTKEEGKKGGKEIVPKEEEKKMKNELKSCHQGDFCSNFPRLSESFEVEIPCLSTSVGMKNVLKENMSLIQSSRAKQLEERWKNLRLQEFELYSKRANLIAEQSKLVSDAMKSSRS